MLRRSLILTHRYLGILLCLLFTMWFLSGIAMVYARDMPRLTAETRLLHLPPLDLSRVRLTLTEAANKADLSQASGDASLLTIMGRPAYRFAGRRPSIVFADTGERLQDGGEGQSLEIASRFSGVPAPALHHLALVTTPDQWTLGQRRQLPLHRIAVRDRAATELYVSNRSGEVVVQTTRRTRALAWISAIPHWMYFTALRTHDSVWRQTILWASGLGTVSAFVGLILTIVQRRVRYAGLMRWHYVTGATFGVFALTWIFSGFLSMEPWSWASNDGGPDFPSGLSGEAIDFSEYPGIDQQAWRRAVGEAPVKQIDFRDLQDEPFYVAHSTSARPMFVSVRTLGVRPGRFSSASVIQRLRDLAPEWRIRSADVLTGYDAYYYDRDGDAPLPVVRVKFTDTASTWIYFDLATSDMVAKYSRRERIQRWIYHGFHSLDFPFWYNKRPLWDIVVITLCLGGALLSAIGTILAVKRLGRRPLHRI